MTREQAADYTIFVVDDTGNGRRLWSDRYAVVRRPGNEWGPPSKLVGWRLPAGPLFVAVHSYGGFQIDDDEATEIATDYLTEVGLLDEPRKPDWIF